MQGVDGGLQMTAVIQGHNQNVSRCPRYWYLQEWPRVATILRRRLRKGYSRAPTRLFPIPRGPYYSTSKNAGPSISAPLQKKRGPAPLGHISGIRLTSSAYLIQPSWIVLWEVTVRMLRQDEYALSRLNESYGGLISVLTASSADAG